MCWEKVCSMHQKSASASQIQKAIGIKQERSTLLRSIYVFIIKRVGAWSDATRRRRQQPIDGKVANYFLLPSALSKFSYVRVLESL